MVNDFQLTLINSDTKGKIFANHNLNRYLINQGIRKNQIVHDFINKSNEGSVVFSVGEGEDLLLVGGVHGDELPPQAALLRLLVNILEGNLSLNNRLHIIPFLIPKSTMENTRYFNNKDMNRFANRDCITKSIIDYALDVNVLALYDCHSTDPSRNPGIKSVFCSLKPQIESIRIAKFISQKTNSKILPTSLAGSTIHGAVEDESNLRGIPAVTCECVSPVQLIEKNSVDESYEQILSFLNYFNAID